MSLASVASPKHCGNKGSNIQKFYYKNLIYLISCLFSAVLLTTLLLWVVLHPSNPQFTLKQAECFHDELLMDASSLTSPPHLLNYTFMNITLISKIQNQKVGIYYDEIRGFATYKGQRVTTEASLPAFYQAHQDTILLTTSLITANLPVPRPRHQEVRRDQSAGVLVMSLKVDEGLQWKVRTWVSRSNRVRVHCIAIMYVGITAQSGLGSPSLYAEQGSQCSTTV